MFTKTARRTLLLALALILCLLPAAAQAGMLDLSSRSEARTVTTRMQEGDGIFSAVWKRLMRIWQKEGASIDPSGNTGGTSGSGTNNSGASIDPTGTPPGENGG